MRGKLILPQNAVRASRITPAHAGKTQVSDRHTELNPDHPRACGENDSSQSYIFHCLGSPPRMRGKQYRPRHTSPDNRITPAHAGKTIRQARQCSCAPDHPRACGENRKEAVMRRVHVGSPPRMRGKRFRDSLQIRHIRITPAHAGKTLLILTMVNIGSDHPRACGENPPKTTNFLSGLGSPPRMRGKHH